MAAPKRIRPTLPLTICTAELERILDAATRIATIPPRPEIPLANPFQSSPPKILTALARINREIDRPSMAFVTFAMLRKPLLPAILSNIAIEPSNSPKRTVMAVIAPFIRFGSIIEIRKREPARIATAPATLRRVPALRSFCQALRLSFTPSRMPVILSRKLVPLSATSWKDLTSLTTPRRTPANIPLLKS